MCVSFKLLQACGVAARPPARLRKVVICGAARKYELGLGQGKTLQDLIRPLNGGVACWPQLCFMEGPRKSIALDWSVPRQMRLALGIGSRTKLDWLEEKWPLPSGSVERFTNLPLDRYVTIVEGKGKWE